MNNSYCTQYHNNHIYWLLQDARNLLINSPYDLG